MSRQDLVKQMADAAADITKELDSLADQAFELQRRAQALQDKEAAGMVDKAVQAEDITSAPAFKLRRSDRLRPFEYLPFDKRLNWKRVRGMSLEKMVRSGDTVELMQVFNEVAQADLEGESSFNLTEANLVKLVKVCQMMMQFVQYKNENMAHVQQLMEEDNHEMQATMAMLPNLNCDDVKAGLRKLGKDYDQVADADMDAMFTQVRTEERTGARELLGGIVGQAKGELDIKKEALASASGAAKRDIGGPPPPMGALPRFR